MANARSKTSTVFNTKSHAVDLESGRTLAPSEVATDIDIDNEHDRNLVLDGALTVLEGFTPHTSEATKAAEDQEV